MNDLERARLADEIKRNPVFTESVEAIKTEIYTAWQTSKEPSDREHQWRMLKSLQRLEQLLASAMDSGKVAAEKLRQDERRGLMSKLVSGR